jgi:hypothetical protein
MFVTSLEIFTPIWRQLLLPSAGVCRNLLTVHCLSEHINCSLFVGTYWLLTRKKRRRQTASRKSSAVKLSLQTHYNSQYIGKRVQNCISFGHLGQRYVAGIVKRFVQCHVFTQSPLSRRSMIIFQPTLRTAPNSYKYISLQCNLAATVILTQFLRSQMCVSVHIYTQYTNIGQTKEIKNWDTSECCVPRKSFHVPFWACVL